MKTQLFATITVVLGMALFQTAHANLIQNGSFENGFTDWTLSGPVSQQNANFVSTLSGAEDGTEYAGLDLRFHQAGLSQTITDTPGASYTLTWWMASHCYISQYNGICTVYFGGNKVFGTINPTLSGWTEYSCTVTGTGSDSLYFLTGDTWGTYTKLGMDNIQLNCVPDGGPGFMLMAATLVGLCGAAKFSYRRPASV